MNIAIVTNRLIKGEGQGRVNYEIARIAAQKGHEVTCIASDVDTGLKEKANVRWIEMPAAGQPVSLIGNQRFARQSAAWLRSNRKAFDITVCNGFNTWAPADINIVHFVHSAWRESPVHTSRVNRGPYAWYQWLYSTLNAHFEQQAFKRSEIIVAVSEKVREELTAIGVAPSKTQVIHNGVNIAEYKPGSTKRSVVGLPESVPLGLFVGDIRTPRKNLETVLAALQRTPQLHLAVVGSTDRSPYPSMASEMNLEDRVHFLGFRKDVPDLMRAADFFTFPSRYEACSLVLLEAMASGLPIITAQTAGGAELITRDLGIVLDDPNDVSTLSDAMDALVSNPDLHASMARNARRTAERLSWNAMAEKYLDLFQQHRSQKQSLGSGVLS